MKNLLLFLTLTLTSSMAYALEEVVLDPGDSSITTEDWAAAINGNFTEIDEDKVGVDDVDHAELSSDNFDMDGAGTALDPKVFSLKGFEDASNSTIPWKNATGVLSWITIGDLIDAIAAWEDPPPVENGSEDLSPDAEPSTEEWAVTGATDNYDAINDEIDSEDTNTYISSAYGGHTDEGYGISDTTTMSGTTSKVEVFVYGRTIGSYPGGITLTLNIGGSAESATEGSQTFGNLHETLTYTFTGEWTSSEVDAATLDIDGAANAGSNNDFIYNVVVRPTW